MKVLIKFLFKARFFIEKSFIDSKKKKTQLIIVKPIHSFQNLKGKNTQKGREKDTETLERL